MKECPYCKIQFTPHVKVGERQKTCGKPACKKALKSENNRRWRQRYPITQIKNHLGHDNIQSTTLYLHLDLNRKRHIQRRFIRHMQSVLTDDSKIEELLQWENEGDLMDWLDSL